MMHKGIEFDVLDAYGIEYHRWVSDIEQSFIAKDLTESIFLDPNQEPPHKRTKSQAFMFLRTHIDPTLCRQNQSKHDPKYLWDALVERFGNIHSTLLPKLLARWDEIRLLDYKRVDDFKGNPIHALGDSVSFGRFMADSLAWEEWSSFSHNRYVEEAERYAQPGSVAQKKAFFEAHYNKVAAQRAAALLEQASSLPTACTL